jgi:hypothetical protein
MAPSLKCQMPLSYCFYVGHMWAQQDSNPTTFYRVKLPIHAQTIDGNTYESAQPAKPAQSAVFATKMPQSITQPSGYGLIRGDQPNWLLLPFPGALVRSLVGSWAGS